MDSSQKEAKVILYFTQRVVFALGIGNQQVRFDKFHGPIELIELPINQEVLLYPMKMVDKSSEDSRIQKFGRDFIICLHYASEERSTILSFQDVLYNKLTELINEITPEHEYSKINSDEVMKEVVFTLKENLNTFLLLRQKAKQLGESLFNLSTLRQLDEKKREIGSLLLGNLKGLTKNEIIENLDSKLSETDYTSSLNDLIEMGYVVKEKTPDSIIYKLRD